MDTNRGIYFFERIPMRGKARGLCDFGRVFARLIRSICKGCGIGIYLLLG